MKKQVCPCRRLGQGTCPSSGPPLVMLPYIEGVSENVKRVWRKCGIKFVYRSGSLCSMQTKVKDSKMMEKHAKVVYRNPMQLWQTCFFHTLKSENPTFSYDPVSPTMRNPKLAEPQNRLCWSVTIAPIIAHYLYQKPLKPATILNSIKLYGHIPQHFKWCCHSDHLKG